MMDVSLVSENFHIYILISRHATDTDTGLHSELTLSLSIRTFTKYANQGGAWRIITTQSFDLWTFLGNHYRINIIFFLKIKITSFARYLFYICEKMWETLTFLALEPPKRLLLDFLWGKLNYRQQMSQLCSQCEECRGGAWGLSCVLAGPRAVKYTGKL